MGGKVVKNQGDVLLASDWLNVKQVAKTEAQIESSSRSRVGHKVPGMLLTMAQRPSATDNGLS